MPDAKPQPTELERLEDWARVGLALYVAATAVIAMRYPETVVPADSAKGMEE